MNLETANKLLELRKKNNLSQEDLAEKLGVSRQAISKWERGEASPNTDNLIDLANLYRISLDELLNIDVKTFLSNYGQSSNYKNSNTNTNQKTIRLTKPNDFNEDEELDYMVNSNSQKIVYPKNSLDREIYPNGNPIEDTPTIEEEYIPPIEAIETPISQVYQQSNPIVAVTSPEDNPKKKKHKKKDKKKSSPPPFTTNRFILWFESMMKKFKISYKGLYTFPYYAIGIALAVFFEYEFGYSADLLAGASVLSIPLYYTFITAIKKRNANWFGYPILAIILTLLSMCVTRDELSALWLATIPFYYWFINKNK